MEFADAGRLAESQRVAVQRAVLLRRRRAYRIGLLNHLVSADALMSKAMEIARQIAANDSRMVQGIKELMIDDVGEGWRWMYDNEAAAQKDKLKPTPVEEGFAEFIARKGRKG